MRLATCAAFAVLSVCLPAAAQTTSAVIQPSPDRCLQRAVNGLVFFSVSGSQEGATARVYFRAARSFIKPTASRDYYYVDMKASAPGSYWAVLPKPDPCTRAVDVHFELRGKEGPILRSEPESVPLRGACKVEWSPEQIAARSAITVGNTVRDQNDQGVRGFRDEGVVARISDDGSPWPVTAKTGSSLPCWAPVAFVAGAGTAAAGGIVISTLEDNPSPSRP